MTGFGLLSFLGTLLALVAATDVKPAWPVVCRTPFHEVAGRCILVDHFLFGTWQTVREICHEFRGDLVNLSDIVFYRDLMLYFRTLDKPPVHFWIGAAEEEKGGLWVWTDGSNVTMGTPYWANFGDNQQMPIEGNSKSCAMLDANMHYYFSSRDCSYTQGYLLCEQPQHNETVLD